MTNCPNCGAPLVGGRCEYCGTLSPDAEKKIQELRRQIYEISQYKMASDAISKITPLFAYDPFDMQKRKKEGKPHDT